MGCDAPVGWNDAADQQRREYEARGWRQNLLGDAFSCLRCGAEVKRNLMDKHDEWHNAFDRVTFKARHYAGCAAPYSAFSTCTCGAADAVRILKGRLVVQESQA